MARRRYVSIKEVAARAGVSFQTASKVLNGGDVRVSFGWTTRVAGDRSSLEELVARSDWAMLEAREVRRAVARTPHPAGSGAPPQPS